MIYETKNDPLCVIASCQQAVKDAEFVMINDSLIDEMVSALRDAALKGANPEDLGLGQHYGLEGDVQFAFVVDSVNYCFWAGKDEPKWRVEATDGTTTSGGWFGLIACLERAIKEGFPILDARYLLTITRGDCEKIFRGKESVIPLLNERVASLREAGEFLKKRCGGQFMNLIKELDFDAIKLIEAVVEGCPRWCDISKLDGKEIVFLKRAQICAQDTDLVLRKHGLKLANIGKLTAFADYKLPQILRMYGVLEYNPALAERIDDYVEIPHDSREEIEIRAATVVAVELLKARCLGMNAVTIDNILWFLSQDIQDRAKPYHRTRTIFY